MHFQTSSLLKVTFLLYVFPILLLIIGAVIGQQLSTIVHLNSSASSAIVGFIFFFTAVGVIKSRAKKMAQQNRYKPKIIKILK